ncbi:MAG: AraC family transcriptional regulator [Planctomycetaceae bacterium]
MQQLWQLPSGESFAQVRNLPWLETLALSSDQQWPGMSSLLVVGSVPEPLSWRSADIILSFLLTGSAVIEWKYRSVVRHRPWSAGSICLFNGDEPHHVRVKGRILTLNCAIPQALLQQAGRLQCQCLHSNYQLASRVGFQDANLWSIGKWLRAELTSPTGPNRAQQCLLNLAVADYLLRNSTTCRKCKVCSAAHRLSPGLHQERIFDGLRRAVGMILRNLGEDGLTIERVAGEIGMSPYHFARLFRAALGVPPHRYIVEQRMLRAKALLEKSAESAADVALQCGFSSQSHLTSTFRRLLGTTPLAYRRQFRQDLRDDDLSAYRGLCGDREPRGRHVRTQNFSPLLSQDRCLNIVQPSICPVSGAMSLTSSAGRPIW